MYTSNKLEHHSTGCVFLSYGAKQKDYVYYNKDDEKCFITKHVVFNKLKFSFASTINNSESSLMSQYVDSMLPVPSWLALIWIRSLLSIPYFLYQVPMMPILSHH